MLFIALAATTNSSITIERCPIDFLDLELLKLQKMGWRYKLSKPYLSANGLFNLVDITTAPSKLKALEEKIHPLPYPGINIDNLPFFVPIATQAKGQTLIHDWVYENRAIYYLELNKLGAEIILADPHRVLVKGPSKLRAAEVICPPALRPAALILLAMLAAKGTSILRNIYSINRGYEDLANRLNKLGAKIKVLS
jgi:UDP-N-acetylglucosamine 1-carboxyvinyltransferase